MKIGSMFSLREYLSLEVGHRLIAPDQRDQYLVSFPRSGNTWMRTMLGVLINPAAEGNPDYTRGRLPGISISNVGAIRRLERPRIVKSHTWYRSRINRALYIVRDGRDVLISLYHYYITRQLKDLPFPVFFDAYLAGKYGQLWHNNVESWLIQGKRGLGENLLVIRFEDLKKDPRQILTQSALFFNLPAGESDISRAIAISGLSRMRKIELERRGPVGNENAAFYRGGKTGEWMSYFDAGIEKRFHGRASRALQLAGYDPTWVQSGPGFNPERQFSGSDLTR